MNDEAPASPCHHAGCSCLPLQVQRVCTPPRGDLVIGVARCLPQTLAFRCALAVCTLLATLGLGAFSLWYWFNSANDTSFWLKFARLTDWALFLTLVYGLLTSAVVLQECCCGRRAAACGTCRNPCASWSYIDTSFRVSANVHMWPVVFR